MDMNTGQIHHMKEGESKQDFADRVGTDLDKLVPVGADSPDVGKRAPKFNRANHTAKMTYPKNDFAGAEGTRSDGVKVVRVSPVSRRVAKQIMRREREERRKAKFQKGELTIDDIVADNEKIREAKAGRENRTVLKGVRKSGVFSDKG